jgi:hypothetical protein
LPTPQAITNFTTNCIAYGLVFRIRPEIENILLKAVCVEFWSKRILCKFFMFFSDTKKLSRYQSITKAYFTMSVSQHFSGATSFSRRFPPNFNALNLKSVFQNSIQVGPGRSPKFVDFCYFLDKRTPS